MEIGIIGLPQTGKKTLFSLLTGGVLKGESEHQRGKKDAGAGISKVYDERLYRLAKLYNREKAIPATIKYILLQKLSKNSNENSNAFQSRAMVDAVCHVVRAFKNDSVFHVDGSVDPVRDIRYVESELLLSDLLFTENRIDRLEKEITHTHDAVMEKELVLMKRIRENLNNEIPLRLVAFSDDERKE
ncbi:MAG: hypothetical protein KKH94_02575 [Candidatus Omnitrophica bacterium]|nr:hypothetical protein [Candidatus Omnitrophota bacterium]